MFDKYSLEICKIFKNAESLMFELNHPYVGTEHLLLSMMSNDSKVKKYLEKYDLTYDRFKNELIMVVGNATKKSSCVFYTPLLKRVILEAEESSKKKNRQMVAMDMLTSLIAEGDGIAVRIMLGLGIDIDKMYDELSSMDAGNNSKLEIYKIGKNLQTMVSMDDIVVGRDKEINYLIETLIRKNKNNPLLVGPAGVGKTAIVEELARRINLGKVPKLIANKKIIVLEMGSLVAGTKYRGEFEEKLNKIIKEVENNSDIILFIDEIHTIVNAGGAEGAINASDILKPYLARGTIKIIGATTDGEYNKFITKDKALTRRFEVIKVMEPDIEETTSILLKIKSSYEKHYNLKISDDNIKYIVDLANNYIVDRYNPDKAIDILDSVCAMKKVNNYNSSLLNKWHSKLEKIKEDKEIMVKENNFKKALDLALEEQKIMNNIQYLTSDDEVRQSEIREYVLRKYNIGFVNDEEKLYEDLKNKLGKVIIGQDDALEKIVDNLKCHNDINPLCLLLTGSTGVGKTKTVKEISNMLNIPLIRLDMSEYSSDAAVNKLIGAPAGYIGYDDSCIFDKIKMQPYSILLLDEIEKANSSVINLFLQILDEGIITNSKGEKINFKNTFIFMTSNAKENKNIGFMENRTNYENFFSKELLSRITDIIHYKDITMDMLKKYLKEKNIYDLNIINSYDYRKNGFRGLDNYLEKQKSRVN